MAYFRILCAVTAGIGCLCGSSIDQLGGNIFKVKAIKLHLGQTPGSEYYQNPHLASRFAKYGLPQRDVTLRYKNFQMSYDQRNRIPNWILEHLNRDKLGTEEDGCTMSRSNFQYHWDPRVKKEFQSDGIDFQSGMNRNNFADFFNSPHSSKSLTDVNTRTNSVPQLLEFYAGVWGDMMRYCRYLTQLYDDVYVFSGPVFEPSDPGQMQYQVSQTNHLAFPTHYFKIIIGRTNCGDFHVGCYLIPHRCVPQDVELSNFREELSVIEKKVGFKLFKDGVNIPETLANILDYRERRNEYMPHDHFPQINIPPGGFPIEEGGAQNGHNGHLGNN